MKTNQKVEKLKKETQNEKEAKSRRRLKKFNFDIKHSESDETQNLRLEKLFFSSLTENKRTKESLKYSKKSQKNYIKRNWKIVLIMLFFYSITFGAILSTPIILDYFAVKIQIQTAKERFISFKLKLLTQTSNSKLFYERNNQQLSEGILMKYRSN